MLTEVPIQRTQVGKMAQLKSPTQNLRDFCTGVHGYVDLTDSTADIAALKSAPEVQLSFR